MNGKEHLGALSFLSVWNLYEVRGLKDEMHQCPAGVSSSGAGVCHDWSWLRDVQGRTNTATSPGDTGNLSWISRK